MKVSDHSTWAIHAWHAAKMRFITQQSSKVLNPRGVVISNPTLTGQWKHLEMHFRLAQNKYEDMLFAEIHTVLCTVHSALQDELSCRVGPL